MNYCSVPGVSCKFEILLNLYNPGHHERLQSPQIVTPHGGEWYFSAQSTSIPLEETKDWGVEAIYVCSPTPSHMGRPQEEEAWQVASRLRQSETVLIASRWHSEKRPGSQWRGGAGTPYSSSVAGIFIVGCALQLGIP